MKITDVRAHHIRIPYDAGPASFRQGASAISALDMVVVEVVNRRRPHRLGRCVRLCLSAHHLHGGRRDDRAAGARPGGARARQIPAFMEQVQRNLHLFGRYGITMFAISGLDIALWDLAGKIKGVPLHRLIGGARRAKIPAYASLLRIGKPEQIAGECRTARSLGYSAIKLHETTTPAVFAAREAIGPGVPLMVDMNCPLSGPEAIAFAHACRDAAPTFLEEPVWPPEDFATLAEVRKTGRPRHRGRRERLHGLSISPDDGGRRGQPRATIGDQGRRHHRVHESGGARRPARRQDHSAFALFRARLPCHAASDVRARPRPDRGVLHEACRFAMGHHIDADANGDIAVPQGPGLGYEPDRDVMEKYRVS